MNISKLTTDLSGKILQTDFLDSKLSERNNFIDLFTLNPLHLSKIKTGQNIVFNTDLLKNEALIPVKLNATQIGKEFHFSFNDSSNTFPQEIETLRQMINLVPHSVYLKDSERRFMIINQAVANYHQLSIDEMIGKRDEDFFTRDDAKPFIVAEKQVIQDQKTIHKEEYFTIQGETKYMETIKVPFFIKHKNEWGVLGVSMDITKRKILLEEQTNLKLSHQKNMMRSVVEAQERERKSIARDLHDGIGQILSASSLNLDVFLSNTSDSPRENLITSQKLTNQAIQEVRTITKNLIPTVLKDFGLKEALRKLCETMGFVSNIRTVFSAHNYNITLEEQTEINLYRICQEIINNAVKHSKAHEISLQLFLRDDILILQIEDDGIGFDLKQAFNKNEGLGLKNIQNRVELINGELDIETRKNHGCSYSIQIDLKK